jgi:glycine cleavage system aminomethyltransferase T
VVTGGASGMSDRKWFRDHLPADGTAQIADLTSSLTTIGLWGPRARDILASTTLDDVSNDGFKFGTCRMIEVGTLRILASRISYVGDLGWELYVPMDQGLKLWDILWEAGRQHGLAPCGIGVYGTTGRLEKSYRAHGNELETEYNVVEAGMAAPRVKEEDFIGKQAHLRHREEQPGAVMCTLTVDDHRSKSGEKRYMLGREPILTRDGKRMVDRHKRGSYVTSAGAGPSIGKHILMAYLPPEHSVAGAALAVEYMGERYPVTVAVAGPTPVFDPENLRIRG